MNMLQFEYKGLWSSKQLKVSGAAFFCNLCGFFDMDAFKGICEARPEGLAPKETQQIIVTSSIHSIDELSCLQYAASFSAL